MSANLAHNYEQDLALTCGKWVNVRGIMRWQGARPVDEPDPVDPVCWCGAMRHQACRGASGKITNPHKGRTTPRTCRCGGKLEARMLTCDHCITRPRKRRR